MSDSDYKKLNQAIDALRAALAEPEQEPVAFDHSIGADRFRVVRGAFWWHVLIGDSPTEHGKFRSRAGAEKMAADLLREFRNGAFVQHEAAPTPRKPLTIFEIDAIAEHLDKTTIGWATHEFAAAIERHHGIGEQT